MSAPDRHYSLAMLADETMIVDGISEQLVRYRKRHDFTSEYDPPEAGQTLHDIFGPIYPSLRVALSQARAFDAPQWGAYEFYAEAVSALVIRSFLVTPVPGGQIAVLVWHRGLRAYGTQPYNHDTSEEAK